MTAAAHSPVNSGSVSHVAQDRPSTVSPAGQSQSWGHHCRPSTQPLPRLTTLLPPSAQPWAGSAKAAARSLLVTSVQRLSRGQRTVRPAVRAVGSSVCLPGNVPLEVAQGLAQPQPAHEHTHARAGCPCTPSGKAANILAPLSQEALLSSPTAPTRI